MLSRGRNGILRTLNFVDIVCELPLALLLGVDLETRMCCSRTLIEVERDHCPRR